MKLQNIPGESLLYSFDRGKNYTEDMTTFSLEGQNFKRVNEGTFFYTRGKIDLGNGLGIGIDGCSIIIELEDGTILGFDGTAIHLPESNISLKRLN